MAAIRLTNPMRKNILDNIIKHSKYSEDEKKKLRDDLAIQGDKVHAVLYKKEMVSLSKVADKRFLELSDGIRGQIDNNVFIIRFTEPLPTRKGCGFDFAYLTLKSTPKVIKDYLKLDAIEDTFIKESHKAVGKITSILFSVNTVSKLIEVWPDVEEFIPVHISNPNSGINLPALPTGGLAGSLDLKKKS